MSDTAALLVAVVLLLANAFFVGAEFALVAARRTAIEPLAERGSARAGATLSAMRRVSLMMAGAQLGITLCSLGLGAVGEPAVAHLIEPGLHLLGLPDELLHPIAFTIALLIVVALHVVIGEMVPKNLALAMPERTALLLGPVLSGLVRALRPVIALLNALANLILRLVRVQPQEEVMTAVSGEDLAELVEESRRAGMMDSEEYSRVTESLAFNLRTAADVVIERADVVVVPAGAPGSLVEELAGATGHSRFPVESGWSHYVHLKDVIAPAEGLPARPVDAVLRTLPAVSSETALLEVLAAMRDASAHVLRVERDGAVLGLATLDDVLLALLPSR